MFHRKSSKTTRPNSSVRFFDLSPRQGPLVGIPPKAFNPLERAGRVRRREPIGKMRTLWLPPLASEPNSLHGVWSRVVRELQVGRGPGDAGLAGCRGISESPVPALPEGFPY